MDLDIWQYLMNGKGQKSQNGGHFLLQLEDFVRLKHLPFHWWYYFSEHGEGMALDFPIKVKLIWHGQQSIITFLKVKFARLNGFH